jgi:hypothetical protein
MLKIGKESKLKQEEVIKRAVDFFGPKGYGLDVRDESGSHATFEGGGGHVEVSATPGKKGSAVDVESVEWDYQAKQFIEKLK